MKTSSKPLEYTNPRIRLIPLAQRYRKAIQTFVLIFIDILAIGAAFWIAYQLRFILLPYEYIFDEAAYRGIVVSIIPVWLLIFAAFQLYNPQYLFGGMQEYSRIFNAVTTGAGALMLTGFLRRETIFISRGWLILSWGLAFALMVIARFLFRQTVYALRRHGHLLSGALLVGASEEGRALAEQLQDTRASGLFISGFIDDNYSVGTKIVNGFEVVGNLNDLEMLVERDHVEEVIIAPDSLTRDQLLNIYRTFNTKPGITLRLSSGIFEVLNTGMRVKELAFVPLIEVNQTKITGFDAFLKWIIDYSVAILLIILLSPVLLFLTIAVRFDSPGSIIYRRRVMGNNGIQFDAFKFRTMHTNGDEFLNSHPELQTQLEREYKLKDDPRVTRLGKFLRKYSLDELPQLFNVLLGQMSVVGPRMISPPEMEEYGKWGMNLLTVKPGITGLWQVNGRSDVSYEERIKLDMYYIRNWTIWLDLYLLAATIPAVFKKKGAY